MSLGINRNTLSFEILDSGNPETLLFVDTSEYIGSPESPLLEATPPGYNAPLVVNIAARKVNVINSGLLGISDILETSCLATLADGVWKFKYEICPYDKIYTIQYYLRTTSLEQVLDKIFRALDFSDCDIAEDDKLKKNIVDIMLAIQSGKANARSGDFRKAGTLYKIASELAVKTLNKLNDTCACV